MTFPISIHPEAASERCSTRRDVLASYRGLCLARGLKKLDWEEAWREYNPDADLWGPGDLPAPLRSAAEVPEWLPEGEL